MVDWLCSQAEKPEQIAVGIETPHGPIVEALMDRGVAVFAIPQAAPPLSRSLLPGRRQGRPARRPRLGLAVAHRSAPLSPGRRHGPGRRRTPRVVAHGRGTQRRAGQIEQPRASAAMALLPAIPLSDGRYRGRVDAGPVGQSANTSRGHAPDGKGCPVLANHRIRRIGAADVISIVKRPALTVARGTAEAACAHIAITADRLYLVNRQIKDVTRRLDALVEQLAGREPEPGHGRAARRGDHALLAGGGKVRPRQAARGGPPGHPGARLSVATHNDERPNAQ